jgi:hypothetical protein
VPVSGSGILFAYPRIGPRRIVVRRRRQRPFATVLMTGFHFGRRFHPERWHGSPVCTRESRKTSE